MKKKISAMVLAMCTLCESTAVMAETEPTVIVNGEQIETSAVIRDNKTYVPIRAVFEQMGCTVLWNEVTKTAKIVYNNSDIEFSVYDDSVIIIDGRMYVPLRMAVQATLGADIEWNAETKTVIINSPEEMTEQAELSVIDSDSSFAVRFNELMPEDKNYMFSPLSLKYALAMAANGGDEEVVKEITDVLGIDDINKYNDEADEYLNENQIKEFEGSDGFYGVGFNVANSIWLNEDYIKGVEFSDKFKNIIEEKYHGTAQNVNNENAVQKINDWCDMQTNHKIPSIINNSDFQACLINAVYFIGKWSAPFDERYTKKDIFTDRNNKENEIDFVNGKEIFYPYYENNDVKIIGIPYSGHLNMYIAMTDKENVDYEKYIDKMKYECVNVSFPKFKTEYSFSAVDNLSELGLKLPFDEKSNHFTNMFNDKVDINMFISDVLQKTFIEVDEEGTEAAALTALTLTGSADEPKKEKIYDFKANKPFVYFIRDDETKEILFMGEYAIAE